MTATLDYSLREGLEFGTDEMGRANFAMILNFATETFTDVLYVASKAEAKGLSDTNLVSVETLAHMTYEELSKQDEDAANMWNLSWQHIIEGDTWLVGYLKRMDGVVKVDSQSIDEASSSCELLLFMDLEELAAATKDM